jgi:hypothetical protein
MAARVRARVGSCGICGEKSYTGAGFLRLLQFPLPIRILPIALQLSSCIIRGWFNRPISDGRTKWTQSHRMRKNKKKLIRRGGIGESERAHVNRYSVHVGMSGMQMNFTIFWVVSRTVRRWYDLSEEANGSIFSVEVQIKPETSRIRRQTDTPTKRRSASVLYGVTSEQSPHFIATAMRTRHVYYDFLLYFHLY